jgi:hypothetical protein
MKNPLTDYLNKEVDRKEFLTHIILLLSSVAGLGFLTKYLAEQNMQPGNKKTTHTYGSSIYEGKGKKNY